VKLGLTLLILHSLMVGVTRRKGIAALSSVVAPVNSTSCHASSAGLFCLQQSPEQPAGVVSRLWPLPVLKQR
jgi:hypothetical protein